MTVKMDPGMNKNLNPSLLNSNLLSIRKYIYFSILEEGAFAHRHTWCRGFLLQFARKHENRIGNCRGFTCLTDIRSCEDVSRLE